MADNDGENRLIAERRAKLAKLREGGVAFPNDFKRSQLAGELVAAFQARTAEALAATPTTVAVAGRLMVKRVMGGSSFVKIQDRSGQIQLNAVLGNERLFLRLSRCCRQKTNNNARRKHDRLGGWNWGRG